jgi:hypothetical protein
MISSVSVVDRNGSPRNNVNVRKIIAIVGVIIVIAGAVAGWVAVGQLGDNADQALRQTQRSVEAARSVADSTVVVANQLDDILNVTNNGLISTAAALESTANVSNNLRKLVGLLDFIGKVDDLTTSLEKSELAMTSVELDLRNASGTLVDTMPKVTNAVNNLRAVPKELDKISAEVQRSRDDLDSQVQLWRAALVATAIVMCLGIVVIARQDARLSDVEDRLVTIGTVGSSGNAAAVTTLGI